MRDNNEWIAPISFVDWLREVGKFFTINYMLAKESVKLRIDNGISYTEFSYMTMQAYDFLHLFDEYNCKLQCGGNDQWGNITAGIELIHKARGEQVYALTFPLITTSSGEKFGKSAGNAIWLDPERTSCFQFYQYWIRTDDRDVEKYFKLFTFLELSKIREICDKHNENPEMRLGQKELAAEVTRMVHGEDGLLKAQAASKILYGEKICNLSDRDLTEIFENVPSCTVDKKEIENGIAVTELMHLTGISSSKGEAKRAVQNGGFYINNNKISQIDYKITIKDLASETIIVLRVGKKNYFLVRIEG